MTLTSVNFALNLTSVPKNTPQKTPICQESLQTFRSKRHQKKQKILRKTLKRTLRLKNLQSLKLLIKLRKQKNLLHQKQPRRKSLQNLKKIPEQLRTAKMKKQMSLRLLRSSLKRSKARRKMMMLRFLSQLKSKTIKAMLNNPKMIKRPKKKERSPKKPQRSLTTATKRKKVRTSI